MSNLDCSAALQPCNCSSSQVCIQIGRSSTECAKNTCVDKASSGGGGGGSSVGAVAGQAVGGVIGGLVIIVVVYFYWRRKRRAGAGISFNKGYPTGTASQPGTRTGAFGLFSRRNDNSSNGLRNFKMGPGGKASPPIVEEKQGHAKVYTPSPLRNVTSPPGPGEEDAQSIKRQSLRFDPSNNGTRTSRRSLSGAGLQGVMNNDNPFADHHSEDSRVPRKDTNENSDEEEGEGGGARNSNATLLSDFSYRSSQSTNIIPIAYIPAHASQSSTIDMVNQHPSRDSRRPHSVSTNHNGGERSILDRRMSSGPLSATSRASRASVPLSLRSNSTGNVHDSLHGATFSTLFDDRNRSSTLPPSRGGLGSTRAGNGKDLTSPSSGLEIIAPGMGATSPPALTTPTMTKDGRPIRPPRAPGLDLKLPTPEASLSPPTSPGAGFPWNRAGTSPISPNAPSTGGSSLPVSPNTANAGPNGGTKSFAGMQARLLNGAAAASGTSSGRETLLSPTFASNNARASAYSTFSQSTDNSGSHMSYILEAPQVGFNFCCSDSCINESMSEADNTTTACPADRHPRIGWWCSSTDPFTSSSKDSCPTPFKQRQLPFGRHSFISWHTWLCLSCQSIRLLAFGQRAILLTSFGQPIRR